MDAIRYFAQQSMKNNAPSLRPGDTVRVHQKIREGNKERIQVFEGTVIAVRGNKGINTSFVVRRIASGVGVEKTFPLHSPNVVKVERLKSSKVRRARLYYLRSRFGRNARMRNEVRNQTNWEEMVPVEEVQATEEVTESPEVEESSSVEASEDKEVATESTEEAEPTAEEAEGESTEAPAADDQAAEAA
jgi:large subunit ribosomal protein L19